MSEALAALAAGKSGEAADAARDAFAAARAQRSHSLKSEAYVVLIEVLAVLPDDADEYRATVEDAFYWAETMPEEIQVWLFVAVTPHLAELGLGRLADRARGRTARANAWLERSINVQVRLQQVHLADVAAGRKVDRAALALERTAAFYADEMFDADGAMLDDAAAAWRAVGRPDRADRVTEIATELRSRR